MLQQLISQDNMLKLTRLEKEAIQKFFQNEKIEMDASLIDSLEVLERSFTGVGFFTDFKKPLKFSVKKKLSSPSGNVLIKVNNSVLTGYLFYIEKNSLVGMEGYTFDEDWPDKINSTEVLS